MEKYNVILPAAGLACRLGSKKPKLLTKFDDQEFLWEKQIEALNNSLNNPNITYIIGFQATKLYKKINKYANVIINENYENTGVAHSIELGLKASSKYKATLVVYGDLYFNENIFNQISGSGTNSFVVIDKTHFNNDEAGCWSKEEKIQRFDYDLPYKWAQICYLKQNEREKFIQESEKRPKALGFEILNNVLEKNNCLDLIETTTESVVFDIDSFKDINRVNNFLYDEE